MAEGEDFGILSFLDTCLLFTNVTENNCDLIINLTPFSVKC